MKTSRPRVPTTSLAAALAACAVFAATTTAQTTNPSWDVTTARGQTRVVDFDTDEGTWMSVDISPDGRWVVFDLLGHVYRVPADGGEAESLTQNSGTAVNFHPRFSPDGQRIAFVSDRLGQNNLWVMGSDGSDPEPIFLDENTRITAPHWMPDGNVIVAVRNFPTYSMHRRSARLWNFPLTEEQPSELVGQTSGTQVWWPAPSPDGTQVYFHHSTFAEPLHGLQRMHHLRRIEPATGRVDVISMPESDRFYWSSGTTEFAPEPSPDGRWLAFARRIPGAGISYRGHTYQRRTALWLRDLDTGEERILMDPITTDMTEAHGMKNLRVVPGYGWAGDSRSLVLSQGGKLRRVWIADGRVETIPFSARVQRTVSQMARSTHDISDGSFKSRFLQWPSSTPNGNTLVFWAAGSIWKMDLPDGAPARITQGDALEYMPVTSPDGTSVAYVTWSDRDGGHLWQVPVAGGDPVRISTETGAYLYPTWSPDGSYIVVTRGGGATNRGLGVGANLSYDLVRFPTNGDPASLITSPVPAVRTHFGPGGRIFYRAMQGRGDVQIPLSQGRPVPETTATLVSIDPEGGDLRQHLTLDGANLRSAEGSIVPSPDGQWVVFRERFNLYRVPFGESGIAYEGRLVWRGAEEPHRIPSPAAGADHPRISFEGGLHPRWRDATTVEFISGNRYFTHDATTGQTDTVEIDLELPRRSPEGTIALSGARIVPLSGDVIEQGTVLVQGSRIVCVGACDTGTAERVVDLAGKTIVPGFIDVHAHHLGGGSALVPEHRYQSAAYLAYGVTTTLDPSVSPEYAFAVGEMTRAGRIVGPRTYATGEVFMPQSPATGLRDMEDARDHVGRLASWGAISVKHYLQPRRDQPQMIGEAARELGISVTNEGADLTFNVSMILDGHTGWEHPMMYVPLHSDAARFFGEAGAVYSPTLAVAGAGLWSEDYFQPRADLWNDTKQRRFMPWTRLIRSISEARRPIEEYSFPIIAEGLADVIRAGGYGALGGHGEQVGMDTHWEMWVYGQALSPMEVLTVASQHGAYMLGLEDDLGSIENGKLADLVILNSNPLDDITRTTDIAMVMKGGVLYDGATLDETWPEKREYGPIPWDNDEIFRSDVRPIDHWNRQ